MTHLELLAKPLDAYDERRPGKSGNLHVHF
jgi:hypothetical protein